MRRFLLVVASAVATLFVGVALAAANLGSDGIDRQCRPSIKEQQRELEHLGASPGAFQGPADADCSTDPALLREHGPFVVVPASFTGMLPRPEIVRGLPERAEPTSRLEELRASPLYPAPGYLPEGYMEVSGDTFDGNLNTVARVKYAGRGGEIEVIRTFRAGEPRYVYSGDPEDPSTVLELSLTEVGGCPAFTFAPKQGAAKHIPYASVTMLCEDGVETTVRGPALPLSELIRVAESLG
ncbi:MAG: hypothetical protein M0R74_13700 [Dehalococcoidia bacterium]|nr:hypothetical protein [Dehalococcoidia bacterium]